MKILVVGSGGREHALVWKLSQSKLVKKIYCAPGNAGTLQLAENLDIGSEDIKKLADFASDKKIDLTIVGPEAPLVEGIVDEFNKKGLACFGPTKKGAQLEGSKAFTRQLCEKYEISGPAFQEFNDYNEALDYVDTIKGPVVVKADGLAAGKGVIIADTKEQAHAAIKQCLVDNDFSKAGKKIVIEEKLVGEEASYLVLCDGQNFIAFPSAQDHKRVFDNDKGPNCYSADTEILTEKGWKTFDALNKLDRVAIYNPKTEEILFEQPVEIHWKMYQGKMIHFRHRALDLLVTPNHRMFVQKRKRNKKKIVLRADAIKDECFVFQTGIWKGKSPTFFVLPEYDYKFNRKRKLIKIPFLDWIRFLGIYLSEGYVVNTYKEHRVYICQIKKSPHFNEMKDILSKLPFRYSYNEKNAKFRINSVQLANYLKQFGDCYNKFVPTNVKGSSPELILEFLKAFNMGDGDIHHGRMRFCTSSKQLIDDLQELIIKCGFSSIITVDKRKTMVNPINKKKYLANPIYSVEIKPRVKVSIRKNNRKVVDYEGYIGCVTVSTGFVLVRRNFRHAISGNTGGMGAYSPAPVVSEKIRQKIDKEIIQKTIDALIGEGIEYKGVLYAGLMINNGEPKLLEYNCRFGDPETQAILPRVNTNLVELFQATINGTLNKVKMDISPNACTAVVLASGGYPGNYEKGIQINGLDAAARMPNTFIFHAGTKKFGNDVVTNGGRVLSVTALGADIEQSIKRAYVAVEKVRFEKMMYRSDIGKKAIDWIKLQKNKEKEAKK
ncbi:MAG: phosphoribosylamine--glycine ligase [Candidatus Diapherotrites archaeon CG08_land_8_20_14_0_20_34_12]|nr:MAG: phosphoribosylamine--glycine ligase [Candidatus Diapherotrites archaeon CG08_land_8_20_14_0_20_34_12]